MWILEDWNKLISEPEFDKEFQEFIMENAPTLEEKISWQQMSLTIPKFSIDFNVDLIENLRQQVKKWPSDDQSI